MLTQFREIQWNSLNQKESPTSLDNGCHTNSQALSLSDDQEVGGGPIIGEWHFI